MYHGDTLIDFTFYLCFFQLFDLINWLGFVMLSVLYGMGNKKAVKG